MGSLFVEHIVGEFENGESVLSWRMDPAESHSDWTIEITVNEKVHGTYSVHKAILTVGPKKSEYFERLIRGKDFAECATSTSRISMEQVEAEVFPVFLDFIYSKLDDLAITNENCVVLHHLGDYYGVDALKECAKEFWNDAIALENSKLIYESAVALKDEAAYEFVVRLLLNNFDCVPADSWILDALEGDFWFRVLKCEMNHQQHGMKSIANQSETDHPISMDMFERLTSEMEIRSTQAALALLEKEKSVKGESYSIDSPTSLQDRCIETLATHWKALDVEEITNKLDEINSTISRRLLQCVAIKAQACFPRFPKRIVVSGAGIEAVNGTYKQLSKTNEASMDGQVNGNNGTFTIYLNVTDNVEKAGQWFWWICFRSQGQNNICYYMSCEQTQFYSLPPTNAWKTASSGVQPTPKLSFEFDASGEE